MFCDAFIKIGVSFPEEISFFLRVSRPSAGVREMEEITMGRSIEFSRERQWKVLLLMVFHSVLICFFEDWGGGVGIGEGRFWDLMLELDYLFESHCSKHFKLWNLHQSSHKVYGSYMERTIFSRYHKKAESIQSSPAQFYSTSSYQALRASGVIAVAAVMSQRKSKQSVDCGCEDILRGNIYPSGETEAR